MSPRSMDCQKPDQDASAVKDNGLIPASPVTYTRMIKLSNFPHGFFTTCMLAGIASIPQLKIIRSTRRNWEGSLPKGVTYMSSRSCNKLLVRDNKGLFSSRSCIMEPYDLAFHKKKPALRIIYRRPKLAMSTSIWPCSDNSWNNINLLRAPSIVKCSLAVVNRSFLDIYGCYAFYIYNSPQN